MAAFAFLASLALCPGAGAGSDAAPVPIPFQQASFNPGSNGPPSVLSALQSSDVALTRNQAFQSIIPGNADPGPQYKPALSKRAPRAAGMSQPLGMLVLGAGMIGLAGLGRRRFKPRRSEKSTAFETLKGIVYGNG
jgi:hypothetical protein